MFTFSVVPITAARIPDGELEALLRLVYVDGGFTEASIAESAFVSANVRARGDVLVAQDAHGIVIGMVVAVPSGSPACRLPSVVKQNFICFVYIPKSAAPVWLRHWSKRRSTSLRKAGAMRMILWTQSSMTGAQQLYVKHGFVRVPHLDFSRGEQSFLVFARPI
jgi:hypothetical protein